MVQAMIFDRKKDANISLRHKLIVSHLTVALFCFLVLLAALFLNIWLGERSKSLAIAANPMQQLNLQSIHNSVERSAALIYEDAALSDTINRERWETVWTEEIWANIGSIDVDNKALSDEERNLIHQLKKTLAMLETQQWYVIDVIEHQGNLPAQALVNREVLDVEININKGLNALIDRETGQYASQSKIGTIKKLADLRANFVRLSAEVDRFTHDAESMIETVINERYQTIEKLLETLLVDKTLAPSQHELLLWLWGELKFYFDISQDVISIRKSDQWNVAQFILLERILPLTKEADYLIHELTSIMASKIESSSQKLSLLVEYNLLLSVMLLTIMLLAAYFSAKYLSNKIVAPIEKLVTATFKLGQEQRAVKIQESGNDELGLLARAFNQMQETLIQKQHELQRLATIDPLTALANRRKFSEVIENEWKRCLRDRNEISLIMIDVDHFKPFNDQYGHQAGDEALYTVAGVIRECLHRSSDVAARYGGEEFVVVLPDTGIEGARKIALQIKNRLAECGIPAASVTNSPFLSVSCGVSACRPKGHRGWERLIKAADDALYRAKVNGRNQVCESVFRLQKKTHKVLTELHCIS